MSDETDRGETGPDEPAGGADVEGGEPTGTGEVPGNVQESIERGRERLQVEADRTVEAFDEGIVDLLSWVLDTETRARIYVYLRQNPERTSEEIAEGTGLYPSTVREALAELTEEGKMTRDKRESAGAGNNPYEYEAIAPSELVGTIVEDVQDELNTVFNLDRYLGRGEGIEAESEPISITVEGESAAETEPEAEAAESVGEEAATDEDVGASEAAESTDGDEAADVDEDGE